MKETFVTAGEPWATTTFIEVGNETVLVVCQGIYDIEAGGTRTQVDMLPAIKDPNK